MPWKELTPMSQREAFVAAALKPDTNLSQLCLAFEISRKTGYKWLARYEADGRAGLEARSRRPLHSPLQTASTIEQKVVQARQAHPTWGARKLKAWLLAQGHSPLPAVSTLTAILRRHNLLDPAEAAKHRPSQRFERSQPNQLWQMDFKGDFALSNGQRCYPLSLLDDHSRFLLMLPACADMTQVTVQAHLTQVFRDYGLPVQMLMDNGGPWGNTRERRHTRLTVWLMRLGIRITHGRPYHPQTQGKVERFHRTLKDDLAYSPPLTDLAACQTFLSHWRQLYNTERPHEALALLPPVRVYHPSLLTFPETLPQIVYDANAAVRLVQADGTVTFHGQRWRVGKAFQRLPVAVRPDPLTDGCFEVYLLHSRIAVLDLRANHVTLA